MAKHRSKVRFDRRIFAERPRNQLPPKEESSGEQLRTFSQLLLLAPFVILLLLGCGQLALSTTSRIPFAETPSNLIAEYGQWGFLQVRSVKKEIVAEIRRDFEGITEVGETFAQPIAKLDFAWLEEPSSPIVVAALPTIIPIEPTIVPSPVPDQQGSILPPPDPDPTKVSESEPTESPPLIITPTDSNPNSPTDIPAATPSPTPTSAGPQPTDTPPPTSTNPGDPTATPTIPPTSGPTPTPTSTSRPTSTSPPPTPTSTMPPTVAPPATSTPGGGGGGSWWNSCYSYRKQVTVSTGGSGVNEGYTASLYFNHAKYVSYGQTRSDGDDVRVVWHSGSNWYELDRVASHNSSWNSYNTEILFRTATGIPAYSSDSNYYLYYGCSSPGSPPDNSNDVYWYSNTFSSGTALSGWTQRDVQDLSAWDVLNGRLVLLSSGSQTAQLPYINHKLVLTGRPVIRNLLVEFDFTIMDTGLFAVGLCSNDNSPTGFYVGYSENLWFNGDIVSDRTGYWVNASNTSYSGTNLVEDLTYRVELAWTSSSIRNIFNEFNYQWNAGPSSANYFCFAANSMNLWLDDLYIREYVDPAPTTVFGPEETQ
jgi:hypothetical protein